MLEWNVYFADINKSRILILNIFKHQGFYNSLQNELKNINDKYEFEKILRNNCLYYFCAKCEFEIILTCCPEWDRFHKDTVSIYDQLTINWDKFVDYIWENRLNLWK